MGPRERGPASGLARAALVVLALLASGVWLGRPGRPGAEQAHGQTERVGPAEDGTTPRPVAAEPANPPTTASANGAPPASAGVPVRPSTEEPYRCRMPDVVVERTPACDEGLPYPACKWKLPEPHEAGRLYRVWRNTVDEHLWARPPLVAVVLATAAEYTREYPGEELAVGDLDAPGPRHETHDEGVDVDLYLPGVMEVENLGAGEYAENYRGLDALQKRMVRARVETLARILATCTQGRLRIYYNDDAVRRRFLSWFEARGWVSPFGRPMQKHNDLHRFHFHVTVPKDLPLPAPEGNTT